MLGNKYATLFSLTICHYGNGAIEASGIIWLGKYKLQLAPPGYLMHGTRVSNSVGSRIGYGCKIFFNKCFTKAMKWINNSASS